MAPPRVGSISNDAGGAFGDSQAPGLCLHAKCFSWAFAFAVLFAWLGHCSCAAASSHLHIYISVHLHICAATSLLILRRCWGLIRPPFDEGGFEKGGFSKPPSKPLRRGGVRGAGGGETRNEKGEGGLLEGGFARNEKGFSPLTKGVFKKGFSFLAKGGFEKGGFSREASRGASRGLRRGFEKGGF